MMDCGHNEQILEYRAADYMRSFEGEQLVCEKFLLMTDCDDMQVELEGHEDLVLSLVCR